MSDHGPHALCCEGSGWRYRQNDGVQEKMESKGEKRDEQSEQEMEKCGVGDAIDWLEEIMMN